MLTFICDASGYNHLLRHQPPKILVSIKEKPSDTISLDQKTVSNSLVYRSCIDFLRNSRTDAKSSLCVFCWLFQYVCAHNTKSRRFYRFQEASCKIRTYYHINGNFKEKSNRRLERCLMTILEFFFASH
mmetsp:Transcript_38839/g.81273  ORF Transcript_38839/g.81273 Transcript_38839/m.81273 type:complete len:129 (+) Transcript_38839:249-635(+)